MAEYAEGASVRQIGRVAQEMAKRYKLHAALTEQVARLESRLGPILGPRPVEAAEPQKHENPPGRIPSRNHADNLQEDNEALGLIVSTLALMEGRIEL